MRRTGIVIALLLCVTGLRAQPTINLSTSLFETIDTRGNIELVLSQGDSLSLSVEFHGIRPNQFSYKVRKGVLYLDVPGGLFDTRGFARVMVTAPKLSRVESQGASIRCATPITGDSFSLVTKGSVNLIQLLLDVQHATIKATGKSDIALGGRASWVDLTSTLGSRIDCMRMRVDSATVTASDMSEVYIEPQSLLRAKAATGATIYYLGSAAIEPKALLWGDVVMIERASQKPMFKDVALDSSKVILVVDTPVLEANSEIEPEKPKKAAPKPKPAKVKQESVTQKPTPSSDGDFF